MNTVRIFVGIVLALASAGAWGGEAAKEPLPAWPWPGPTPAEIVEAKLKEGHVERPGPQDLKRIEDAVPAEAPARPAKPRKVLVWGRLWTHSGNVFAEEAVKALGRKTGAFHVIAGDDPRLLLPEGLKTFERALFTIPRKKLYDTQYLVVTDGRKYSRRYPIGSLWRVQ